jgi:hypothetical protein
LTVPLVGGAIAAGDLFGVGLVNVARVRAEAVEFEVQNMHTATGGFESLPRTNSQQHNLANHFYNINHRSLHLAPSQLTRVPMFAMV